MWPHPPAQTTPKHCSSSKPSTPTSANVKPASPHRRPSTKPRFGTPPKTLLYSPALLAGNGPPQHTVSKTPQLTPIRSTLGGKRSRQRTSVSPPAPRLMCSTLTGPKVASPSAHSSTPTDSPQSSGWPAPHVDATTTFQPPREATPRTSANQHRPDQRLVERDPGSEHRYPHRRHV